MANNQFNLSTIETTITGNSSSTTDDDRETSLATVLQKQLSSAVAQVTASLEKEIAELRHQVDELTKSNHDMQEKLQTYQEIDRYFDPTYNFGKKTIKLHDDIARFIGALCNRHHKDVEWFVNVNLFKLMQNGAFTMDSRGMDAALPPRQRAVIGR